MPGYRGRLNDRCVTIAEVLKGSGYFTAMTGKWHVGQNHGVFPWERGFDRNLTAPAGGFYYSSPRAQLFLNGAAVSNRSPELAADWYSTDLWTEFGLKFIDEAVAAKKPFFLYLAHNAPHFPLQAPASDIARFRGKYKQGWDRLRRERYERQLQMGLIKKDWPLSPRSPAVAAWDTLTEDEKDRFDHIMAIYAAVVNHLDASVGTLVEGLRKRELLDNTLILFLSDNGGNAESGPLGRLDGEEPGTVKSTVFCGESWANLENTPFRRYKHFNHEGGIATPLIVHWPAVVKTGGELRTQPGHLIDIMATCVDVSGASYPGKSGDHAVLPMEGRSLLAAFANQPIRREALFWEHEGNAAVRVDDWKLVRAGRNAAWELYNLARDRTELNNMAAAERERVDSLSGQWEAWAERTQVKPYPSAPAAGEKKKAKQKSGGKQK